MLLGEPFTLVFYILLIALNILPFFIGINVSLQVTLHTILIVYLGSIHSLRLYGKDINFQEEGIEKMTQKDALMFPIIGGATLTGLFLLFKYFDKDMINIVFHFYFSFIGTFVIAGYLYNRISPIFPHLTKDVVCTVPKIRFITDKPSPVDSLFLYCFLFSLLPGLGYYFTKHYQLNNLLGIVFSLFGIENLMLSQSKVGFLLLFLLFFYDIYFVFFTPIMVGVAKNLDGPIKLMFPKTFNWSEAKDFNMIGLGDIVLPGVFLALMLRYDYLRNLKIMKEKKMEITKDDKQNNMIPFSMGSFYTFMSTFAGYCIGILVTLAIMNFFMKAQPALLYLVPGVLLGSLFAALLTGTVKQLWNFDEEEQLISLGLKEVAPEEDKKEDKDK